jgi:S-adenosyl-L-methionine hydrolase (adenosine-forming)
MARPVIALVTDFGTADHYVGVMKGVILGICPDASIVDITHEVPAHDVLAGALELQAACPYFPPGTIFVTVVDPGVGSTRRGIAASTAEHRFVAPDNGVLTPVLHGPGVDAVELAEPKYARRRVSRTFEGRDRFAPAAAWLATGVPLDALGPRVTGLVQLDLPRPRVEGGHLLGSVVRIDRFGNLVTNIDRQAFECFRADAAVCVEIGSDEPPPLVDTYTDVPAGHVCALFGSTDHLEIACHGRSARTYLGLGRGAAVRVRRGPRSELAPGPV